MKVPWTLILSDAKIRIVSVLCVCVIFSRTASANTYIACPGSLNSGIVSGMKGVQVICGESYSLHSTARLEMIP